MLRELVAKRPQEWSAPVRYVGLLVVSHRHEDYRGPRTLVTPSSLSPSSSVTPVNWSRGQIRWDVAEDLYGSTLSPVFGGSGKRYEVGSSRTSIHSPHLLVGESTPPFPNTEPEILEGSGSGRGLVGDT